MAPAIGSYTFQTLKGSFDKLATVVVQFSRPGINGTGYRDIGTRAQPTTLNSFTDVLTLASVSTTFDGYKDLVGSLQTITSDLGVVYPNVMILSVSQLEGRAIGESSGGLNSDPGAILRCSWEVQRT